jgi:hypothetical protein
MLKLLLQKVWEKTKLRLLKIKLVETEGGDKASYYVEGEQ